MRKLVLRLRPKTIHLLPETSVAPTAKELRAAILDIKGEAELLELDRLVDLMALDRELEEEELFELYSTIAYMTFLLVLIEDRFPHEYYPPFAIESHIRHAQDCHELSAMALHLNINEAEYVRRGHDRRTLRIYRHQLRCKSTNLNPSHA